MLGSPFGLFARLIPLFSCYAVIVADRTDIYQRHAVGISVLLVTLARLSVVKLAEVAPLSLEMLIAIVAELDLSAMDKLSVIS